MHSVQPLTRGWSSGLKQSARKCCAGLERRGYELRLAVYKWHEGQIGYLACVRWRVSA